MKRLLSVLLVMAMVVTMLVGCTGNGDTSSSSSNSSSKDSDSEDKPVSLEKAATTIAFSFEDLETEFWVASHKAIKETLEEKGIKVIELNCQGDANKQLEQVKDAITQDVSGIIMIPVDGDTAVSVTKEANSADIPIAIFNRPPTSDEGANITIVCDNATVAEQCVDYMVGEAQKKFWETGEKLTPLIMVGDLGDPNAIARKDGFYAALEKNKDIFNEVIEVPTEWDAATALANLQSAIQANPDVDFLFTSSDFLFPTIQSVLEPLGKWAKIGEEGHVIMGGLDGDATAGELIDEGYIEGTGVQDVYLEADLALNAILEAIETGDTQPDQILEDPGFALTQGNLGGKRMNMWGNILRESK